MNLVTTADSARKMSKRSRSDTGVSNQTTPFNRKYRFAQHFLEPAWVVKLIKIIHPTSGDRFLEIGPGHGVLTSALSNAGATVTAVEIDRNLANSLASSVPERVTIINDDFLKIDIEKAVVELEQHSTRIPVAIRVVGNLPYNASVPILLKVLRASGYGTTIRDATLMLQREVADRVTAGAGSPNYGPLAITTQLYATARRVLALPPGAFRPVPNVRSALVVLRFRPRDRIPAQPALFERMVRSLFTQRRKQGGNAIAPFAQSVSTLAGSDVFQQAGLDPKRRPEEFELSELIDLADVLASYRS